MNKFEELIAATKLGELMNKKEDEAQCKKVLWALAIIGAIAAGAAADADISVDDVLLVALRDSFNRAVVGAGAALHASISNLVSHDISSHKYCSQPQV